MQKILIRYGELTLKGKNRSEFERILFNNIQKQLKGLGVSEYHKDRNRIYIDVEEKIIDEVVNRLKIIPGIHSFCLATKSGLDLDEIKQSALDIFDQSNPEFKVETKRINKDYPLVSNEISRSVGAHILINNDGLQGLKVNVHDPKQLIYIEIHKECSYLYNKFIDGMGGLPIGSSGHAYVLLSGGIDSPVAAILAMKRGLKIDCVHFSSPPYTNQQSLDKVKSLVKVLQYFDQDIKMYNVNFTDVQLKIHEQCVDKFQVTLLRRLMIKKAEMLGKKDKVKVLVTGESLGQVASQTIDGMYVSDNATSNLILRPLITMDKMEIIALAKKYQTFDISILPYEDCCVVFLPKKPATYPQLDEVLKEEAKIDIKLVEDSSFEVFKYKDLHQSLLDSFL